MDEFRFYDDPELATQDFLAWSHFSRAERDTAERLRELQIEVVSVDPADGIHGPTPDAVVVDREGTPHETLEMKHPKNPTRRAIQTALRRATPQSHRVCLDVRECGISEDETLAGLRSALTAFGGSFKEVLVIGADFGVLWP